MNKEQDERFMQMALHEAQEALLRDEVPIGAVVECAGRVIARAHNLTQTLNDPTAHAEMQAITAACIELGGKYLKQCTIYVTVEPCPMCAAALRWAQIGRIVYGTSDEKFGYSTLSDKLIHPKTQVAKGVMQSECAKIVQDFFKIKR